MPTTTPSSPSLFERDPELRARTLAALHNAWLDVQRAAQTPVEVGGPDGVAHLLAAQRRVAALDKKVKFLAVIALWGFGAGWEEIGARLGMRADDVETVYGQVVSRWLGGDPAPWAPKVGGRVAGMPGEGNEVVA